MLPDVGQQNRTIRTMTQKIETQAIGLDRRPRLQTRSLSHSGVVAPRKITMP